MHFLIELANLGVTIWALYLIHNVLTIQLGILMDFHRELKELNESIKTINVTGRHIIPLLEKKGKEKAGGKPNDIC